MILCENNYQRVIYTNQLLQPEAYGRLFDPIFKHNNYCKAMSAAEKKK